MRSARRPFIPFILCLILLALTPAVPGADEPHAILKTIEAQIYAGEFSKALEAIDRALAELGEHKDDHYRAMLLMLKGEALTGKGDGRKAGSPFDEASGLLRDRSASITRLRVLYGQANSAYLCRDYQKAIDCYIRARKDAIACGSKEMEIVILSGMGEVYSDLGRHNEGLEHYRSALAIACECGNESTAADIKGAMGYVYWVLGEYDNAIRLYQESRDGYRKTGNRAMEGSSEIHIATVLLSRGESEEALRRLHAASALVKGRPDLEDSLETVYGGYYESRGELDRALDCYNRKLEKMKACGDRKGQAATISRIAMLYQIQGDYKKALLWFNMAGNPRSSFYNPVYEAALLINKGVLLESGRDYEQALIAYEKAKEIAEGSGDPARRLTALYGLSRVYRMLEQYDRASMYLEESLRLACTMGRKADEARILSGIGTCRLMKNRFNEARQSFDRALKIACQCGNRMMKSNILFSLAVCDCMQGRFEPAEHSFSEALDIAEKTGDKSLQSMILSFRGNMAALKKDPERAISCFTQSLKIDRETGSAHSEAFNLAALGKVYQSQGKDDQAIGFYQQSVAIINVLASKLKVDTYKMGFLQNWNEVYQRLIELLIRKGRYQEAFDYNEIARSRVFLDTFESVTSGSGYRASSAAAEQEQQLRKEIYLLQNGGPISGEEGTSIRGMGDIVSRNGETARQRETRWARIAELKKQHDRLINDVRLQNPHYGDILSVSPPSLPEIQKEIPDDTAIVEYMIGMNDIIIWVIDRSRCITVKSGRNPEEIRAEVDAFRKTCCAAGSWKKEAASLYGALIAPVKTYISGKRHIVLIPHLYLHHAPFAAFLSAEGKVLIDEYDLSYAPSSAVWKICHGVKSRASGTRKLVAFALGGRSSWGKGGDSLKIMPLNSTVEEVKALDPLFPGSDIKVGAHMTLDAIRRDAPSGNILHFATHGFIDFEHPLLSGLSAIDGNLTVAEISGLKLKADMVTLSACTTAIGPCNQGDELMSLSRAFMCAGSREVLASLWCVDDSSTAALMKDFYRYLKEDRSAVAALRKAQQDLRGTYSHPYYWAPFIVIGDDGQ